MIFIRTNSNNEIVFKHFIPESLNEEELETGYLVGDISIPENQEGKEIVLYYTPEKGFWHEYKDIPKTKEEELEEKIDLMQQALAELSMLIATS